MEKPKKIWQKLCEMKQVQLIDGKVCRDYVHMYVAIPPKMCVSEFMSQLKGKRGYYVTTIGNMNEETIRKYIQEQEENDKLEDGRK